MSTQSTVPTPLHPPLEGAKLVFATIAVALGTFMIVLDSSIANVALPTISGNLGVSFDEGTWVITMFAAANAVSIPLTGWLTQRFGQIRLFVGAILLFVLASVLCGLATSLPFLLGARVLQGFVSGPLIPLSQAILLNTFSKEKSSIAMAFWGMTATVGPIAGPSLGGWITESYSWTWIFYINIPIGIFAAIATWVLLKDRDTPVKKLPIDVIGLSLLILWVSALQIMLDKGRDLDWFSSPIIISLALISAISFVYFLIWELTEKYPITDLKLFADRNFLCGTLAVSVGYGLFFGNLVLMPQWLQAYLEYPSMNAGLILAPIGIFAVIFSPIVGKILPKVDARLIVTVGFMLFALVFFLRSNYTTYVDTYHLVIPTLIQGIPIACFFIPLSVIVLLELPPEKVASGAGLVNFVRIFFGAIGTSVATTEWSNRTIFHHAQLTEEASQFNPTFTDYIASTTKLLNLDQQQGYRFFDRVLTNQASMLGLNDIFYATAIIFLLLIPIVWLTKSNKKKKIDLASAASH